MASTFSVDGIGPVSMVTGSTPARAKVWKRARGVRPSSLAFSSLITSTAEAPSLIWLELPAVTLPSGLKAGFRLASVSAVVPGRMPSSAVTSSSLSTMLPVSLSRRFSETPTISFSKRPSAVACSARCCDWAPKASSSSREMPHLSAIISAEMPWGTRPGVGVAGQHTVAEGDGARRHRRAHGRGGHDLHAGGDRDVVGPGDDALGREVGGLLRRAALAVDGGGGHRLGEAGGEDGVAADVEALVADLHHAAHDDVVDEGGIEVVALGELLEHLAGEVGGVPARELSVALAAGGADGVDDDGGGHGWGSSGVT